MQQQQLDFSKLYCQSHPYELITNYCNDQKCLTGLCATCICSHTQMHAQIGTIPHYQNIRDTFCSLHDQARQQIALLEQDKNKLGSLRQSIEVKKITIKKTIRQLREDAINKVREEFDSLQKKIMNDINNQEKKQGYHSNIRFQTLSKNLARQTQTLLGYIEGLNSPNFLDWTKKLKREALMESNQNRVKIERQITDNQNYTGNLKWNPNFIEEISGLVKKVFTLQFFIPKQIGESRANLAILRPSNPNVNIMTRSSSQPKLSQQMMVKNNSQMMGLSKFADSTSYSTFFNEPMMQKSTLTLNKRSVLRNNTSMISDMSQNDLMNTKQNSLNRSSYIQDLGMVNNSSFLRAGFQNQRISNLIDLKRSNNFESMRVSMISKDGQLTKIY